jgi:transcriptional regulator with XRE-family HTH domain
MIKPFPVVELDRSAHTLERFRKWSAQFGVSRLGRSLGVSVRTVQRWCAGERRPEVEIARTILALSQIEPLDGLPLTYDDLYGPARTAKVEPRTVKKVQAWE